ncbi:hypothetical protein BO94DRAFT_576578 [Aspergillus sclerotioniger CBS 115572]|uniref:Uncharacterized protein n=1 Tax=Aspergillus sclerotioniger CBS 115572 TaxID=1450535 RepID=A0A317W8J5_9EURO|nr:hypothetical protein BO94DRAFT_576578 [Aspergillus sclerotioniger CBS 115572]PWY81617.1 hypothetical protein BO94DRAFT_576578 [Aspergillus sclerotioniger CBS 115572]
MRSQILIVLSILFSLAPATPTTPNNTQGISDIVSNLPQDNDGVLYLGGDGVLRSVDANGRVVTYQQLNPQQISEYNSNFPAAEQDRLSQEFQGVDGRDVTNVDQLLNPSRDLLPPLATTTASQQQPTSTSMPGGNTCGNVGCTSQRVCRENGCSSCLQVESMATGYCH